jgi:hypothetical protein
VPDDHVQLALRRTGGLAGLPMEAALDTRELAPEEAAAITSALDGLDFGTLAPADGPPDTFQYRLEVRRGDRTQTATFGERQVPAALRPLLGTLMQRAEPAPRR